MFSTEERSDVDAAHAMHRCGLGDGRIRVLFCVCAQSVFLLWNVEVPVQYTTEKSTEVILLPLTT